MNKYTLSFLCFAAICCCMSLSISGAEKSPPREYTALDSVVNTESLRLAIDDLSETYGKLYTDRGAFAARLDEVEKKLKDNPDNKEAISEYEALKREALLQNPLLDGDQILLIRRRLAKNKARILAGNYSYNLGVPYRNTFINRVKSIDEDGDTLDEPWSPDGRWGMGWDDEITVLSDLRSGGTFNTLYRPDVKKNIQDLKLDFDGKKMLFCSIGTHGRFHIFEVDANGENLRQVTPTDLPDIDFFDPCYLPDGKILFTSTACYQGLPCQSGQHPMALLYRCNADGTDMRQLTFDQDSDWGPTILNSGSVMYLRYEYSELAHYFSRILFTSNPDGTQALGYYGTNSYWPNSIFHAQPIPNESSQFVGIVTGHHAFPRMGKLILFDVEKGRRETEGVVQEIPRRNEVVEPEIRDILYDATYWPKFMFPRPLDVKYYLVIAKPTPKSLFGLYLVDVFDNMLLIKEMEDEFLSHPVLFQPSFRPPVIPDRVDLEKEEGTLFITSVYEGPGLQGVPKDTVKKLRLFTFHFAHLNRGGHRSVGVESGWDVKRILGTVLVNEDGSASFTVPAKMPIALQPLDENGAAIQLMRSWLVCMPGENLSCIGCHEDPNQVTPSRISMAAVTQPKTIELFYGQPRPYAFRTEIQPILDKYCVGCHAAANTEKMLKRAEKEPAVYAKFLNRYNKLGPIGTGELSKHAIPDFSRDGYKAFHPYVRRPGPESDIHLQIPGEWHVESSEVVQRLREGHYGVQLDDESREKLFAWIDLNAPYRGAWEPEPWREFNQQERRMELAQLYGGLVVDPESEYTTLLTETLKKQKERTVSEPTVPSVPQWDTPQIKGFPFSAKQAEDMVEKTAASLNLEKKKVVSLGDGSEIVFRLIPAGTYLMGNPDEQPPRTVTIEKPFYISETEITNAQYNAFDSKHDSRYIDMGGKDQVVPGFVANLPNQPVLRVSWNDANRFGSWLGQKIGHPCSLPSEEQWEWASRAGTSTALWFGDITANFSKSANIADNNATPKSVSDDFMTEAEKKAAENKQKKEAEIENPFPRTGKYRDGFYETAPVASFAPNRWGLFDMHGNVAEWTSTGAERKIVRGGSYRDRIFNATSSSKVEYLPWHSNEMTGFRIILEISP